MAVFTLAGIAIPIIALGDSTRLTPNGVQFPDGNTQTKAWKTSGSNPDNIYYNNGNVGIGTKPGETPLYVHTPAQTSDAVFKVSSGNQMTNPPRMVVNGDGKVGIGTAIPGAELEIYGSYPYLKFNGHSSSDARQIGVNNYGLAVYNNDDARYDMVINNAGNVGIGVTNPIRKLDVDGWVRCDVIEITGGADLSERFDIIIDKTNQKPCPGMVVSIDADRPGLLNISRQPYDRKVAGVISGAGGVNPGMLLGQQDIISDKAKAVALTGRVYCLADASHGSIEPGDLLTTSDLPGHAMKVTDYHRAQGAILGKAMSFLTERQGFVLVLVTLQ